MSASFDFEAPDHFTTGTVGPSGQRVFYLQAREARRIVTLKVEKEQIRALAEYLSGFLARLKGGADAEIIESRRAQLGDQSLEVADASVDVIDRKHVGLRRKIRPLLSRPGVEQHSQRQVAPVLEGLVMELASPSVPLSLGGLYRELEPLVLDGLHRDDRARCTGRERAEDALVVGIEVAIVRAHSEQQAPRALTQLKR